MPNRVLPEMLVDALESVEKIPATERMNDCARRNAIKNAINRTLPCIEGTEGVLPALSLRLEGLCGLLNHRKLAHWVKYDETSRAFKVDLELISAAAEAPMFIWAERFYFDPSQLARFAHIATLKKFLG